MSLFIDNLLEREKPFEIIKENINRCIRFLKQFFSHLETVGENILFSENRAKLIGANLL